MDIFFLLRIRFLFSILFFLIQIICEQTKERLKNKNSTIKWAFALYCCFTWLCVTVKTVKHKKKKVDVRFFLLLICCWFHRCVSSSSSSFSAVLTYLCCCFFSCIFAALCCILPLSVALYYIERKLHCLSIILARF